MTVRALCRATAIAVAASLVACASAPADKAPSTDFRYSSIALVSPQEIIDATQPRTRGQEAQKGAGTGLVSGTLGGAAVGAIACGPFLYGLCVTGLAWAGMVAGGATGALYGFTGFPKDVAHKLERRVEALSSQYDLQSLLVTHIRQQVPPAMLAEPDIAEVQAVLVIENVEFIKKGRTAHLVSTVRATFESTESRRVPEHGTRVFKGTSNEFEVDDLLDEASDSLRQAMRQGLLEVADQVVAVMHLRWEPGNPHAPIEQPGRGPGAAAQ